MKDEHFIRELQQIQMIQKKIIENIENIKNSNNPQPSDKLIEELDYFGGISKRFSENLSSKKTLDNESIAWLDQVLKAHLAPIVAYTEMVLSRSERLSAEERNKLIIIGTNIKQLEDSLTSLRRENNPVIVEKDSSDQENAKRKIKELEQQKLILEKTVQHEERKNFQLGRKQILIIAGFIAVIGIIVTGYSLFVVALVGQEYRVPSSGPVKDSYIIQNLKGDTINTWISWRLVNGTIIHVNVIDAKKYPKKMDLIKDIVLSKKAIQIDQALLANVPVGSISTYYPGWAGATAKAGEKKTKFYIPNKFEVIASPTGEGEVTISLTDERSSDGYAGFTKSIADETQNQILKSHITIYEVDKLSDDKFKAVLRHEMGHALGLAHSTATEDLMHPVLRTDYPYISECDIDAIRGLYDGNKRSEVVCQK